jgi:hypothetical protein
LGELVSGAEYGCAEALFGDGVKGLIGPALRRALSDPHVFKELPTLGILR